MTFDLITANGSSFVSFNIVAASILSSRNSSWPSDMVVDDLEECLYLSNSNLMSINEIPKNFLRILRRFKRAVPSRGYTFLMLGWILGVTLQVLEVGDAICRYHIRMSLPYLHWDGIHFQW